MTRKFWAGLIIVIIVALSGAAYQKFLKSPRCDYDGSPVPPIYEVNIILKDGRTTHFCSVYCAKQWFERNKQAVDYTVVTDEIRGNKIESYMAYFVESELITNETNDNRIHVFQQRQDALTHAEKFNGSMIDDPFYIEED